MNRILGLFTLIFAINAHAITVNDLVKRYGKRAVMGVIADKIGHKFTITDEGSMQLKVAPNPDYVTEGTLAYDATQRAGMTAETLEKALLEDIEQAKKEKHLKAEQEEHLRQWKIEQVKEAERRQAEEEERNRQQLLEEQIRQAKAIEDAKHPIVSGAVPDQYPRASGSCDNSDYLRSTPPQYRWSNDNAPGTLCHDAVAKVRVLDNDPNYDCDANIRRRWQEAIDYATSLGCTL